MKSINISDLLKLNNPNIIDIRSNYSFINGHIPNATNISAQELLVNYSRYLNRNDVYFIYCQSGSRSRFIANKLNSLGYSVVNINGGYNSYLYRN